MKKKQETEETLVATSQPTVSSNDVELAYKAGYKQAQENFIRSMFAHGDVTHNFAHALFVMSSEADGTMNISALAHAGNMGTKQLNQLKDMYRAHRNYTCTYSSPYIVKQR